MKIASWLMATLLLLGCTAPVVRQAVSPETTDFLTFQWEASDQSSAVRVCELLATGEPISLDAELVLGVRHLVSARVTSEGGIHEIVVALTPEGRQRLKDHTAQHTGRRLAIILDDRVIALPTVMRPIDTAELPLMPVAEAELAESLARRINQATSRSRPTSSR